jgi:hypothetical protein
MTSLKSLATFVAVGVTAALVGLTAAPTETQVETRTVHTPPTIVVVPAPSTIHSVKSATPAPVVFKFVGQNQAAPIARAKTAPTHQPTATPSKPKPAPKPSSKPSPTPTPTCITTVAGHCVTVALP